MTGPTCIIKGCENPGAKKAVIDIGPTAGDALVPESEREHEVWLCDEHYAAISPPIGPVSIEWPS